MIYFTADTHFGHAAIAAERGYGIVEDHDEAVLNGINSYASKADRLYILGDFCWSQPFEWRRRLLCKQVTLIRGNHDSPQVCRAFGGNMYDTRMVRLEPGKHVFLSHYAHAFWPGSHIGEFRGRKYVGRLHVYGHTHDEKEAELDWIWPERRSMDVGIDTAIRLLGRPWPFSADEIVERLWDRKGHHHVGDADEAHVNFSEGTE